MGARLDEFDLERGIWTVPASRMKAGREHRVPLSPRAIEILQRMAAARTGEFVFPGNRHDRPLSNMALEMLMRRLKVDATVHGSDPHSGTGRRSRQAYRARWPKRRWRSAREQGRGGLPQNGLFEKRRALMEQWAEFLAKDTSPGLYV